MRSRRLLAVLGAAAAVLLVPPLIAAAAGDQGGTQLRGLSVLVPNAPGGGDGITARTAANAMEDAGITGSIEVFNLVIYLAILALLLVPAIRSLRRRRSGGPPSAGRAEQSATR
jgi:hypothetical protein